MWAIFFRSSGFLEAIAVEDRETVTADWYTTVCLPKVITAIESQWEKTGIRGILLHHDNQSLHTARGTPRCDFWLIPRLKDQLRGRRFSTNEELRAALFQMIGDIPKEEWKKCFDD
ncbi:hypothetical protein LOD99_6883 [Oopsacas minuta]|uniref:Transposase n=1 Tax=Oopsacas minuta TaxID=111878 RepID=A0AAV7JKN3_9METZ|nr:hypothetical protein LOD99_6883 [Oopsacas minuta]